MKDTYTCTARELLSRTRIPLRVLSRQAMPEEIARLMLEAICEKKGGRCVIICPVGPVEQYPVFVELVNARRVSLRNVWFVNMDEYLDEYGRLLPPSHPLSFQGIMDELVYSKLDPDLAMPPAQRLFPQPGRETEMDALLRHLGGADCCLTGVGINGHIAFNEPPSPGESVTDAAYAALGTRCLPLAPETIVNNGSRRWRGALDAFPRRCITLGMRQLLTARTLKVYLYQDWQWGILRKIALEPASRFAPASFLQTHPNAEMVITPELLEATLPV